MGLILQTLLCAERLRRTDLTASLRSFLFVSDQQAPRFTSCPPKQAVNTTFRTNVAKNVQWKIPTYYDNSIAVEGDQLTLVEQNGYTSPRDFGIGTTRVKYTVKDKSGLEDTCQFEIRVEGTV